MIIEALAALLLASLAEKTFVWLVTQSFTQWTFDCVTSQKKVLLYRIKTYGCVATVRDHPVINLYMKLCNQTALSLLFSSLPFYSCLFFSALPFRSPLPYSPLTLMVVMSWLSFHQLTGFLIAPAGFSRGRTLELLPCKHSRNFKKLRNVFVVCEAFPS